MKNAAGSLLHELAPQRIGSRINADNVGNKVQFPASWWDGLIKQLASLLLRN
jgi:hypothetical protein